LKDSNERNKNLEDKVRDLKRQITILTLEGKEVSKSLLIFIGKRG